MTSKVKLNLLVDVAAAEQADEILTALGMNMSDAVNLMLHQVHLKRGLPFDVKQIGGHSHLCAFCPVNDPTSLGTNISPNDPNVKVFKTAEEMWADLPKADLPNPSKVTAPKTPFKTQPKK